MSNFCYWLGDRIPSVNDEAFFLLTMYTAAKNIFVEV